jgi:IS30 family transposase
VKRKALTKDEIERIGHLRESEGLSIPKIADSLNVSTGAVQWCCLREGFERKGKRPRLQTYSKRPRVMKRGKFTVRNFTPEEDERLLALRNDRRKISEIAKELGRKPNSIQGRLLTLARRDAQQEAAE